MNKKFQAKKEILITQLHTVRDLIKQGLDLTNCTFQGLDLKDFPINWRSTIINNTTFLGCELKAEDEVWLRQQGAIFYAKPTNLPYQPFRNELYSWQELMDGFSPEVDNSVDLNIYQHFSDRKYTPSINEALWQRIHDHAMDDGIRTLLEYDEGGMTKKKCVGFMGGHSVKRNDPFFVKSAITAKKLTEAGFFIASGGGPGIMEAANLGAYFAFKSDASLFDALNVLRMAPHYTDKGYHQAALEVINDHSTGTESLAIPTWFYGHEPSNLFASHIAKYFSNSIREDTLLAISLYGIVFAPGSAGTTQEIFMDAAQNHYATFNYYSPMVFLGKKRYEIDTLIYPLLKQLAWGKPYYDLLHISDDPEEVVEFLLANPPLLDES